MARKVVYKAGNGDGAPAGAVMAWTTGTAPAGYVLCDGSALSRTEFAALFDVVGTTYGAGDGSTTFNVPNLKGRVPVGLDSAQTEFDALAETGGAKTHTLTSAEMPAHTHVQDAHNHTQNAHSHLMYTRAISDTAVAGPNGSLVFNPATGDSSESVTATNIAATATNQSTGGGAAHSILPPYLAINYIIKT